MALVVGADLFGGRDEARLHRFGERLLLGNCNQKLGELIITVDGLTGHRDEPLVPRGIQLAALDGSLVVDPPRVVARELAELFDQSLNAAALENPARALFGHEARAPQQERQGLLQPPLGLVVERPDVAVDLVNMLESVVAALNREAAIVRTIIHLDDDPPARRERGDVAEIIVERELPVPIERDSAPPHRDTERHDVAVALMAMRRATRAIRAAATQGVDCRRRSPRRRRRGSWRWNPRNRIE